MENILGALLIMVLRMADVSLGTFRTIMVVQGKKYLAASIGFFEVLIWIFAMRYIFQNLDNTYNMLGYAVGFSLGNILGITLEEKVALGYVQVNIISLHFADKIADELRKAKFGVTILPAEGGTGGMSLIVILIRRKDLKSAKKIIDEIDTKSFITVQHSRPYRGFIHASRK
ncbi:MAG: DUF2179 domain-containing protein [Ignavibacteriales bacterium]|nr:DUF2179 domain-containing protein [Ignavibacteriales bacterium]